MTLSHNERETNAELSLLLGEMEQPKLWRVQTWTRTGDPQHSSLRASDRTTAMVLGALTRWPDGRTWPDFEEAPEGRRLLEDCRMVTERYTGAVVGWVSAHETSI